GAGAAVGLPRPAAAGGARRDPRHLGAGLALAGAAELPRVLACHAGLLDRRDRELDEQELVRRAGGLQERGPAEPHGAAEALPGRGRALAGAGAAAGLPWLAARRLAHGGDGGRPAALRRRHRLLGAG